MWKGSEDQYLNPEELRNLVEDPDCHLHEFISRRSTSLRGTRPYWIRAKNELEVVVRQLGTPSLFFTLSAADLQWDDFYTHLPDAERAKYLASTKHERDVQAARCLQENPLLAAHWLTIRLNIFMNTVLSTVFKFKDHWYRFEWQARGSGHIHGFLWVENAPTVTDDMEAYLAYWGAQVTAMNPGLGDAIDAGAKHPSSKAFVDRSNKMSELCQIVNCLQRHSKCPTTYCKRQNRLTKQPCCRFGFPHEEISNPRCSQKLGSSYRTFDPVRNDSQMGKYNPTVTMAWLANSDVAPCTDLGAVISYLAKYCTKAEQKSVKLQDMIRDILPSVSAYKPIVSLTQKLMNRFIGERDWSA